MISVLVPVYNVDVRPLINSLVKSCKEAGINHQIIVLDDFSDQEYRNLNSEISEFFHVSYIELSENYGRAKVRNKLANLASHPWLLFLDCDSIVPDESNFISNYIKVMSSNGDIFNGGRIYPNQCPGPDFQLHYNYGSTVESRKASLRSKNPILNFHSNNFMVRATLFNQIQFDESIHGYGYEDIAFAYLAHKKKASILHIDNPVVHSKLDKNYDFLLKSQNALKNLFVLYKNDSIPPTRLITIHQKLKNLIQLLPFKEYIEKSFENRLVKGKYKTWTFQLWKLLKYHNITSQGELTHQ